MSLIICIIVVLLFFLALLHLVTGISNDAVNFLNPAIGSRVSSRNVILAIAAAGLITGVFFSVDMMDLVRSDVVNPSGFKLHEILILYIAVSLTNIIILDAFNTVGFPISTTITLVFSLIGGALAIIVANPADQSTVSHYSSYINTDRILVILAGILTSIFAAFILGAIAQFITRLIFTFKYQGRYRFLFAIAGALAVTSIMFLFLKQGIGEIFAPETFQSIQNHGSGTVLALVFVSSLFILWGTSHLFNIDIPKIFVLFGTFILALSFTTNNLVNFIGLPLSGIESINEFLRTPGASFYDFPLNFLNKEWIQSRSLDNSTYLILFFLAGLVMAITLFTSKKLHSVTEMEVYLGRQLPGEEHFKPTPLSKTLVRGFLKFYKKVQNAAPNRLRQFISSRFEYSQSESYKNDPDQIIHFDSVRASVNLVISSLFIVTATSLRFPLSTTFVVFMVAMGTSFADQAWGRDSAVYRVSGVLSILGGWFITAIAGFAGAFVFTLLISYGGIWAAVALFMATLFTLWRTTVYHRKKIAREKAVTQSDSIKKIESIEWLHETGREKVRKYLLEGSKIYFMVVDGLMKENSRQLKEAMDKADTLQKEIKVFKSDVFGTYGNLPEEAQDSGQYFVQILDYLYELANGVTAIGSPVYYHVENQHKGLTSAQQNDLTIILEEVTAFLNFLIHYEKEKRYESPKEMKNKQNAVMALLEDCRLTQIRRIRSGEGSTRVNVIYMDIMGETKNILIYSYNLFQSICGFYRKSPEKAIR